MDSNNSDNGRPIERPRSHSDASSSASRSGETRKCHPEKLIDVSRVVRPLGTTFVDDGALISAGLASVVANKAFRLRILTENRETGENNPPYVGQAGLIRGARLTPSPPPQRRAIGDGERPMPALRCSRFEAIPTTCLHNILSEVDDNGDMAVYRSSVIVATSGNEQTISDFARAGEELDPQNAKMIRTGDEYGEGEWKWVYGHDVSLGGALTNPRSHFTQKDCTFEKVERSHPLPDYQFRTGQKIGIAVFRDFVITCDDAGMPRNSLSDADLVRIYGHVDRVNIYTGEITRVSPDGTWFEHNINSFRGCSGAIVFLLDENQNDNGVVNQDYGKAVAVHVGGKYIGDGERSNLAFSIL
jgi:hypothetical protein